GQGRGSRDHIARTVHPPDGDGGDRGPQPDTGTDFRGDVRMGHVRLRGKAIAIFLAATWLLAIGVYSAIRPRIALGKELLAAANRGDAAKVHALLAKGASVYARDHDGHTAACLAAYNGHAGAL